MTPVDTAHHAPAGPSSRRPTGTRVIAAVLGLVLLSGCAAEVSGVASGAGAARAGSTGPVTTVGDSPSSPRATTGRAAVPATSAPAVDPTEVTTDEAAEPAEPTTRDTGTPAEPTGASVATTTVEQVREDLGWLKPGARASYYFGAVSSAAHRYQWTENPAGDYTDPKTGKRYSSDKGIAPASQAAEGVMHSMSCRSATTGSPSAGRVRCSTGRRTCSARSPTRRRRWPPTRSGRCGSHRRPCAAC